jgi:hypothetical protein
VKCPEPFIERNGAVRIVTFEMFVMKIMGEAMGIECRLAADDHPAEADMAGRETEMDEVEDGVDRMGQHDPMDQHAAADLSEGELLKGLGVSRDRAAAHSATRR